METHWFMATGKKPNLVFVIDRVACHGASHPKCGATKEARPNTKTKHFLRHARLFRLPLAHSPRKVGAPAGPVARRLIVVLFSILNHFPTL